MDLSIKEIVPDPNRMNIGKELDPRLPDISTGSLGLMIGGVKTGKTTIITNMLLRADMYKDCFSNVYIFSNTIMNDSTGRWLKESYPETIFSDYSDAVLLKIIRHQEQILQSGMERPAPIAIILDDFVGISRNSEVYKLATRYRHYNCGLLLFSSQGFKEVHPLVRSNMTFALLGKNSNSRELSKITEELGSSMGGDQNFLSICKHVWKVPYHFVHIDYSENPPDMYDGFEKKVWEGGRALEKMKNVTNMEESDSDDEVILEIDDNT